MIDAPSQRPDAPIDASADGPLCAARPPNLVSWWTAEGQAMDVIGTNEGSLVGGVYAAGEVGQAFRLNGTNQYVTVPDSATLDFSTQITIEAWIYPEVVVNARIVDKTTVGAGDGFLLDIVSGKLRFGIINTTVFLFSGTSVQAQVWTHVAATFDGANMRVYINGAENSALAQTGTFPTNAVALTIGAASNHTASLFNGNIDEVAVYDRGLTAAEIQSIYAADAHGKCPP